MDYNTYKIDWCPNKKINNNYVNKLLEKNIKCRRFTNYGPNIQLLEKNIFNLLEIDDNKSVIVVNNATIGLHVLTNAIEYNKKKSIKWATQSFTFPSSCQGNLLNCQIKDIDIDCGLDLNEIDENIDGIIVTNIFGNIVDINKYVHYCNINNKILIFDNAATPYTYYKNKNCVNYGTGCIISFHHTKPIGFGEGGAIIVDKEYEKTIRSLINFGMNLENDKYYLNIGNNYKMSEISAIYIIQYLDNFNIILSKHMDLYNYLQKKIENKKYKLFPSYHTNKILSACFALLFDNYKDDIEKNLLNNSVFCKKYYYPLKKTNIACKIYEKILCIPCTIDMNYNDIDFIIQIIDNTLIIPKSY